MPTNYAGNDASYPANIPLPNDGEPAAAAFLNPSWQKCADRTAWLKKRQPFADAGTASVYVPAQAVQAISTASGWASPQDVAITSNGFWRTDGSSHFKFYAASLLVLEGTENPTQFGFLWTLDPYLHHGATLASVVTSLIGSGLADYSTSGEEPAIGVFRLPHTPAAKDTAPTALLSSGGGFAFDPSASAGAFDTAHTITFTPNQNNVIDLTAYTYKLMFYGACGPTGEGSSSDLYLFGHKLNFSTP